MSLIRSLFSCVGERSAGDFATTQAAAATVDKKKSGSSQAGRGRSHRRGRRRSVARVKFGRPLVQAFGSGGPLPAPLRDLLVHIARDGVAVCDLFRRPGNPLHMRKIIKRLAEGRPVDWAEFNFWTAANVAKRFLLAVPDGVFGKAGEAALLAALDVEDSPERRVRIMHGVIAGLPVPVQQLLALLYGIWFRMIYHTDVNSMSVEAVAKSVAGSMFHTCTDDPRKVERASKVMELLISGFASAELFGEELIEYFTSTTGTTINRNQLYAYEVNYPASMPPITEAQYKSIMQDNVENYRGTALEVTPTLITDYSSLYPRTSSPLLPLSQQGSQHHQQRRSDQGCVGAGDAMSLYSMQSDITGFQRTRPPLTPQSPLAPPLPSQPSSPPPPSISTLPVGLRRCQSVPPLLPPPVLMLQQLHSIGDEAELMSLLSPAELRLLLCCSSASEGQQQAAEFGDNADAADVDANVEAAAYLQSVWHQQTPSGRFNSVKRRQLQRLARRTRWFLSAATVRGVGEEADDDGVDDGVDAGDAADPAAFVGGSSLLFERPLLHQQHSATIERRPPPTPPALPPRALHLSYRCSPRPPPPLPPPPPPQPTQQQQQPASATSGPDLLETTTSSLGAAATAAASAEERTLSERRYFLVSRVYGQQQQEEVATEDAGVSALSSPAP